MPGGGLFADKDWLVSPEPFVLSKKQGQELERLGHRLRLFQEASDLIYRRSVEGSVEPWVAEVLDAGKPGWMLEHVRSKRGRTAMPAVIRPDLMVTEGGFSITELDSVPGGIGLTAWLNATYAGAGWEVMGGAVGMVEGFGSLFPGGADILVSEEAGDYWPEMEWLAPQLAGDWLVARAEDYRPRVGRDVYRFFELFDHANVAVMGELMGMVEAGELRVSPPVKPHLEEKLWAGLFWSRVLQGEWGERMRGSQLAKLREMVPFSWVVDPAPVPRHAVLPRLGLGGFSELAGLSQRDRQLVLKVSGFSEQAWGSRGVTVGHDVSGEVWGKAVEAALAAWPEQPYVLQEFAHSKLVEQPYWDPESGERKVMEGRARLCPYYFVGAGDGKVRLGGVLATVVPADKKVIHGMRDAVLVPCVVAP